MPGKSLYAYGGVQDAIGFPTGTENFVVGEPAEGHVGEGMDRCIESAEQFPRGGDHSYSSMLRLGSVGIGHPEITLGVEGATVATIPPEVVNRLGFAAKTIALQCIAKNFLCEGLHHVEKFSRGIDVQTVGESQARDELVYATIWPKPENMPFGVLKGRAHGVGPVEVAPKIESEVVETAQRLVLETVGKNIEFSFWGTPKDSLVFVVADEKQTISTRRRSRRTDVCATRNSTFRIHPQQTVTAEKEISIQPSGPLAISLFRGKTLELSFPERTGNRAGSRNQRRQGKQGRDGNDKPTTREIHKVNRDRKPSLGENRF